MTKKIFYFLFFPLIFANPNFALAKEDSPVANEEACTKLADMYSKNNSLFAGYGNGLNATEALKNAQIDLASRIRQQITSESSVDQNDNSTNYSSKTKSIVNEILVGANVVKRCSDQDSASVVVTMDKELFFTNLEKKLSLLRDKAKNYLNQINSNKNSDDENTARLIDKAKKFSLENQSKFESDLELCKTFKHCNQIEEANIFIELQSAFNRRGDTDVYEMILDKKPITQNFKEELQTLLEQSGLKVTNIIEENNKGTHLRKILASCLSNHGNQAIASSSDLIVGVKCTVEVYTGKEKTARKTYSCTAVSEGRSHSQLEDAIHSCHGRLSIED